MEILFCRKNFNYPLSGICSYSPSKKMEHSINLLIIFLIKEFPNINIKLNDNSVFVESIKMFCDSNNLNKQKNLVFSSYIKDNKFYIEIEESTETNNYLILDKHIFGKIIIYNNVKKNTQVKMSIDEINNCHNISYDRTLRQKNNSELEVSGTQEFFTPKHLCDEILDKISEEDWKDITKTFLDSTCGNGNFLVNIYERKLKWCSSVNDSLIALKSIYGTELMDDNTNECRNRLYLLFKQFCDNRNLTEEQFKLAKSKCIKILKHNIVCINTFKWDYEEWRPYTEEELKKNLKKKKEN